MLSLLTSRGEGLQQISHDRQDIWDSGQACSAGLSFALELQSVERLGVASVRVKCKVGIGVQVDVFVDI